MQLAYLSASAESLRWKNVLTEHRFVTTLMFSSYLLGILIHGLPFPNYAAFSLAFIHPY